VPKFLRGNALPRARRRSLCYAHIKLHCVTRTSRLPPVTRAKRACAYQLGSMSLGQQRQHSPCSPHRAPHRRPPHACTRTGARLGTRFALSTSRPAHPPRSSSAAHPTSPLRYAHFSSGSLPHSVFNAAAKSGVCGHVRHVRAEGQTTFGAFTRTVNWRSLTVGTQLV